MRMDIVDDKHVSKKNWKNQKWISLTWRRKKEIFFSDNINDNMQIGKIGLNKITFSNDNKTKLSYNNLVY